MKKVMFVKGKKGGKRRDTRESRIMRGLDPMNLPMVHPQIATQMTLRFQTTAAFQASGLRVTYQNLLDSWFIAGTATTGYQLFDFVKIRRVTIRCIMSNPAGQGVNASTVEISFPGLVGGTLGSGKLVSDTALGQTRPAFVTARPDPKSQASQYQGTTAGTAFIFRAVDATGSPITGAIIDVDAVWKNDPEVSPAALQSTPSGLVAGNIYFGTLDGARIGGGTTCKSVNVPSA